MTTSTRHALRMLMVSCALTALAAPAFANGQGTPIEPAPDSPAPVMIPSAPEPAPVMAAPRARWSGLYLGGHAGYAFMAGGDDETILFWHRGLSLSDIALGGAMLEKAKKAGLGQRLFYAHFEPGGNH